MKRYMRCTVLIFFVLFSYTLKAQDTLRLTLQETEATFLQKNLLLLAQQYAIDEQQALIIQAKAYPNPTFTADFNAYDPGKRQLFHTGNTGQKAFSFEQLIVLAGKRKTNIEIAKKNKQLAEQELSDVLRNLKWQLHSSFFQLHQQNSNISKFSSQLKFLDTLITSYESQALKGNIPLKDVIRLKSAYLEINNSKSEAQALKNELIKNLQVLIQNNANIIPQVGDTDIESFNHLVPLDSLITSANTNRPDIQSANIQNNIADLNVRLQKQLAIPDLSANTSYDQRGGAFNNQLNVGFSVPLALWNRNRGNIKAAESDSKQIKTLLTQKGSEVNAEVQEAWKNMQRSINEYAKVKVIYNGDFEIVLKGVSDNFQKRNLSILEFVDFIEAYNNSLTEYQRVKTQLALSAGQINYITATKIY